MTTRDKEFSDNFAHGDPPAVSQPEKVPHDREHGWPSEHDTTEHLLRSLSSFATSVKVTSGEMVRIYGAPKGSITQQASPAWLRGVGERIDHAVDILRARFKAAPPVVSQPLQKLIDHWTALGESELAEATEKEMPAAMGVAAMRLHCARELAAALMQAAPPVVSVSQPPQEWRCFHCDEVFTTEADAREHFGGDETRFRTFAPPACEVDIKQFRELEDENAQLRLDNENLENDARLWHEAESDRVRRIGNVQWWQEMDSREGEKLVLQERVAALEAQLATRSSLPVSPPPQDDDGTLPGYADIWPKHQPVVSPPPLVLRMHTLITEAARCFELEYFTRGHEKLSALDVLVRDEVAPLASVVSPPPTQERNQMIKISDGFPRRQKLWEMTPAEKAIYDAVRVVEAAGADVRLTDAVILLQAARDSVADFVDGIDKRRSVIEGPVVSPPPTQERLSEIHQREIERAIDGFHGPETAEILKVRLRKLSALSSQPSPSKEKK